MKLTELEAAQTNGTHLAYTAWGKDGIDSDHADEVIVVNADAVRQVHSRGRQERWSRPHEATGVTIEFVNPEHKPRRETVAQQKLVGTWAEYTQRRTERDQAADARKQRLERSKAKAESLTAELTVQLNLAGKKVQFGDVEVVPVGSGGYGNHYRPPYKYSVRLSNRVLDWLLEEKRGR